MKHWLIAYKRQWSNDIEMVSNTVTFLTPGRWLIDNLDKKVTLLCAVEISESEYNILSKRLVTQL